jgi:hypothetical protein
VSDIFEGGIGMLLHVGQVLLLFIPTNIMGLYVAAGIQGKYPPLRKLAIYGSLAGVLTAVFRAIPGPFGLHAPLIALTLIIMIRHITGGTWGMAVLSILSCQVAAIIAEGLIVVPLFDVLGLTLAAALQQLGPALVGGWLGNVVLLLLVLIVYLRGRKRPRTSS